MGTEIFKIDAPWAEKLTKTIVSFLLTPTVNTRTIWHTRLTNTEKLMYVLWYVKALNIFLRFLSHQ